MEIKACKWCLGKGYQRMMQMGINSIGKTERAADVKRICPKCGGAGFEVVAIEVRR